MFESITLIKAKMILSSARSLHNVPLGAQEVADEDSMAENLVGFLSVVPNPLFPISADDSVVL